MNRKEFVRTGGMAAAAMAFGPSLTMLQAGDPRRVRMGVIGVGGRGQSHVDLLLRRSDVDLVAICDVEPHALEDTRKMIAASSKRMPQVFTGDAMAWKKLLEIRDGLDGVIIATPWEWHAPMVLGALEAGLRYVATEVILGLTVQEHWDVVKAAEKYQAHVMMLENVCYRRDVMAVLNMVRQGLFGELIHLQGGYQHNLRGVKFNNGYHGGPHGVEFGEKGYSEAHWRTNHSVHRNGDLYPTHGIGPLANYININRGNRFTTLASFSSKARGLHDYILKWGGEHHPNAQVKFRLGDVVTTSINCANGETILLQHDTDLPRPYSLGFRVQGTGGLWMDVSKTIYVDGQSAQEDEWDDEKTWLDKYDHPLWVRWSKETEGAGHGGMDFFVIHAFVESIKRGVPTPLDVYDAATWSVLSPLSEQSIQLGNQPVDVPDFTEGQWMFRQPVFALDDAF